MLDYSISKEYTSLKELSIRLMKSLYSYIADAKRVLPNTSEGIPNNSVDNHATWLTITRHLVDNQFWLISLVGSVWVVLLVQESQPILLTKGVKFG